MQNNWVLLQGRLCHAPNYSATRKGLHKVAFRLAVPRPPRVTVGLSSESLVWATRADAERALPPLGAHADYVTVVIVGKPAWDFKQLDLQMGAAVRVQGHLRSWDVAPEDARSVDPAVEVSGRDDLAGREANSSRSASRDYHVEVIAEKVEPLNEPFASA